MNWAHHLETTWKFYLKSLNLPKVFQQYQKLDSVAIALALNLFKTFFEVVQRTHLMLNYFQILLPFLNSPNKVSAKKLSKNEPKNE